MSAQKSNKPGKSAQHENTKSWSENKAVAVRSAVRTTMHDVRDIEDGPHCGSLGRGRKARRWRVPEALEIGLDLQADLLRLERSRSAEAEGTRNTEAALAPPFCPCNSEIAWVRATATGPAVLLRLRGSRAWDRVSEPTCRSTPSRSIPPAAPQQAGLRRWLDNDTRQGGTRESRPAQEIPRPYSSQGQACELAENGKSATIGSYNPIIRATKIKVYSSLPRLMRTKTTLPHRSTREFPRRGLAHRQNTMREVAMRDVTG